jgi:hypothetical protein
MINAEPSGAPLMCLGMSWPSNRHPPGSGLLPAISPNLPREVRVVGLMRSEEREVSRQEELTGLSRRRAARYICTLRCCSVTRCCLGRQSISSAHRDLRCGAVVLSLFLIAQTPDHQLKYAFSKVSLDVEHDVDALLYVGGLRGKRSSDIRCRR